MTVSCQQTGVAVSCGIEVQTWSMSDILNVHST